MMLHGRIPGKRMRPCAGGHKRVSEPSCYQKMGNPFSMPQVLHICRHLFHGFNRVFHFAVKTRRLRFFRNQQQCAIQMEAQSKGFRSLLSRQHCQLLLVPRHKRTRQIAILTSIGERHRARNRVNFRNRKALYSSQTYSCHGSEDLLADPRRFVSRIRRDSLYLWGVLDQAPEKRVKCSAVVDVARCHLRLHPCLPQMVCASYHVSPPMSSPGCPYDNATVENFLGTLKTECLYHPAPPRAPRWNSSLPSTSIFIILNVSRSKNGLTLPEIRGWTV